MTQPTDTDVASDAQRHQRHSLAVSSAPGGGSLPATRQQRLNLVATAQWGVVRQSQLVAAGLNRSSIRRWTAAGRLHRIHRGVYAVAPVEVLAPQGRDLASVWACGDAARLNCVSAAVLWALLRFRPAHPQVIVAATGAGPFTGSICG